MYDGCRFDSVQGGPADRHARERGGAGRKGKRGCDGRGSKLLFHTSYNIIIVMTGISYKYDGHFYFVFVVIYYFYYLADRHARERGRGGLERGDARGQNMRI